MKQPIPDFAASPMEEQYKALVAAFDYFNRKLFNGILPRCIISFSRFFKMTSGYSIPERWHRANEQGQAVAVHEICLSPSLLLKDPIDLFAKLVHEMVHIWQWDYGNPSRNGYHNKEWARKMEAIGLMPSHTGEPDGKKTGQTMDQYVLDNGLFKNAVEQMPDGLAGAFVQKVTLLTFVTY